MRFPPRATIFHPSASAICRSAPCPHINGHAETTPRFMDVIDALSGLGSARVGSAARRDTAKGLQGRGQGRGCVESIGDRGAACANGGLRRAADLSARQAGDQDVFPPGDRAHVPPHPVRGDCLDSAFASGRRWADGFGKDRRCRRARPERGRRGSSPPIPCRSIAAWTYSRPCPHRGRCAAFRITCSASFSPREKCSAAAYRERALVCIEKIRERGRLPIVCGGTGLYINALTRPLGFAAQGDEAIRDELTGIAEGPDGRARLHAMLESVDPESAARLHPNDVRRVVRALEIFRLTGRTQTEQAALDAQRGDGPFAETNLRAGLAARCSLCADRPPRRGNAKRGTRRRSAAFDCGTKTSTPPPRRPLATRRSPRRCAENARLRKLSKRSNRQRATMPSANSPGSAATRACIGCLRQNRTAEEIAADIHKDILKDTEVQR